ncbi:hypothetical protein TcasGA2_TC009811 [Tribolium castaneum]|uniref:Uncharacterized protein n=1 Tax=Tribolium castaneum TaxID=7070 RepID=D6WPT0_TRICA|nr:hypothetical protein TcasGA2_TC009811 [Tribolium castaneum]
MGQLVAEDSHGGGKPPGGTPRKRSPYRHTISEVVETITHNHHPCNRREVLGGGMDVPMEMGVAMVDSPVLGYNNRVIGLGFLVRSHFDVWEHLVDFGAVVRGVEVVGTLG